MDLLLLLPMLCFAGWQDPTPIAGKIFSFRPRSVWCVPARTLPVGASPVSSPPPPPPPQREAKKAARKDAEGVEGAMAELAVSGEAEGENTS